MLKFLKFPVATFRWRLGPDWVLAIPHPDLVWLACKTSPNPSIREVKSDVDQVKYLLSRSCSIGGKAFYSIPVFQSSISVQ